MKNSNNAVEITNATMVFNLSKERMDSIKEYLIKLCKRELFFTEFKAVNNISFNIKKGEVMGILGLNGSGKSTLLKMIAGIYKPTVGKIEVNGSIAPLIELGAGFDFDLTARENIYLNGAVLGHSKKFIDDVFEDIVTFTELRDFLDVPMKNYSSGMVARIGFAVATLVKPDILIADEILAVGDFLFQEKCEKRIKNLMGQGTTVILVSHDITQIRRLCTKVVWIEKGNLKMIGDTEEICEAYYENSK